MKKQIRVTSNTDPKKVGLKRSSKREKAAGHDSSNTDPKKVGLKPEIESALSDWLRPSNTDPKKVGLKLDGLSKRAKVVSGFKY